MVNLNNKATLQTIFVEVNEMQIKTKGDFLKRTSELPSISASKLRRIRKSQSFSWLALPFSFAQKLGSL